MSKKEAVKARYATPEDEYIIKLQYIRKKIEAAAVWCEAKYGDVTIMHDMLFELSADMNELMTDIYDRKEVNDDSN